MQCRCQPGNGLAGKSIALPTGPGKLIYLHHRIQTQPRRWQSVAAALRSTMPVGGETEGTVYGIFRSQIGRPRDELTAITCWPDEPQASTAAQRWLKGVADIREHTIAPMRPTLRPLTAKPPQHQGNYAFRYFETPAVHWQEFLELCEGAWPDFESSYDSQVIGLWRFAAPTLATEDDEDAVIESLLLTRRPNLAMWERSKIPQGEAEAEVRRKLNRRYDLCNSTVVFTSTLLTAVDREDKERWT